MPGKVVEECIKNSCSINSIYIFRTITFYEYVFETATLAKKAGIKNIVKSNGYINPEPLKKLCTVIDAANIDLKAFTESTYLKLQEENYSRYLILLKYTGIWEYGLK